MDTSLSPMGLKERDAAAVLEPGLALRWEKRSTGCVVWGKGGYCEAGGGPMGERAVPWVKHWVRKDQRCLGTC